LWCDLPEPAPPAVPYMQQQSAKINLITSCEAMHPSQWSNELLRIYFTNSFTLATKKVSLTQQ
jgi:hypothetical protein